MHTIARSDRYVKMYQLENDKSTELLILACMSKHKSGNTIIRGSTALQLYNDIAFMKLAAAESMLDMRDKKAHYFCRPLYGNSGKCAVFIPIACVVLTGFRTGKINNPQS